LNCNWVKPFTPASIALAHNFINQLQEYLLMNYTYPTVGADFAEGKCRFTVWAPGKKHVELVLSGGSVHPLQKDERGFWSVLLPAVSPGDTYQYRLDNGPLLPDPASRRQPQGVHGPSAITDTFFAWNDHSWKGLPLSELVIYELHTGTFSPEGNFDGIIKKLDYLQQLGINAIELMPVAQFPGERNWGYDGAYPFAVQESYGGVEALKRLVDEAHRKGIAVILDVVYNHLGPEGNYLPQFAPYFTDKYRTPWGTAINYDDAYCDGVRNYYWQNALLWFDEFHIDGLRLDAVHAIWDNSARHFLQELQQKVARLEKKTGRKKILIAEFDLNNPRYINPSEKGGYGLDGQWVDEFHHALHAMVTGEVNGYYEDFGEVGQLAKALKDGYVFTGEYSKHRKKHFGVLPAENPYSQFVVFAQNHDHIGNRLAGDRLTTQLSYEGLKLAAATVLLAPQVPLVFMGEEYGETNPFQYFVHHSDGTLIAATRKGRREEFQYFNWEGEIPDPQSEETFLKCKLSWHYESDAQRSQLLNYYKKLIAFRKTHPAMQGRDRDAITVFHQPSENKIIGFTRQHNEQQVLVVLNFDRQAACFSYPLEKNAKKIFDSSHPAGMGPGAKNNDAIKAGEKITMPAESALIYEL
jgi:maltooligosyltrehalose trehalohydrolase